MKLSVAILASCVAIVGCKHASLPPDAPRITPQVRVINSTIASETLSRSMHLRVIVPVVIPKNGSLPVIYLLHGAGTDYRDWTNNSNIADFAAKGFVLVFPDEPNSYYINEATGKNDRYEDYFLKEVVPQVHKLAPFASLHRADTAIVGISRGGYGAVVLALRHPDLFSFVGDLSGAVDFPERHFRWKTPLISMQNRQIFAKPGSSENQSVDPFILLRKVAGKAPYFFISCGTQDPLFEPNRRFAEALTHQGIASEFHALPGAHNWITWSQNLPTIEDELLQKLSPPAGATK